MISSIAEHTKYESHFNHPSSYNLATNPRVYKNISEENSVKTKDDSVIMKSNIKLKGEISVEREYITRSELEMQNKMIDSKIESLKEGTYARIDNLTNEIKNINNNIENTIKLTFYEREEIQRKERKESQRYLIGTIIIGSLSLALSIYNIFMK